MPDRAKWLARLITLVAISGSVPEEDERVPPADSAVEGELFGVTVRVGWSEFAETRWRPRFAELREWTAESYRAPNAGGSYQVVACRTAIVTVPMACELLLLDLTISAEPDGIILAEKDAFDPNVELSIDDTALLVAAAGPLPPGRSLTDRRRQILILPSGTAGGEDPFGDDPSSLSDDQERLIRKLMFKDTDIEYRPTMAPILAPVDMNGPDRQSVFVWDSNTLAQGLDAYPQLANIRILGIVLSNCQILGALHRCADIREAALQESDRDQSAGDVSLESRRSHVESRVLRVGILQRQLSMGVEMHALATAVAGGRPLLRYHQAAVEESSLPHLLAVTQHLLASVLDAVRVEQELLTVQEAREAAAEQIAIARATRGLLDQSEAFKAASLVFAAVALVISLAGLFAGAAAIPRDQDQTLLQSAPGSVLFVLGVAVSAAFLGVGLRQASRVSLPPGWKGRVRLIRTTSIGVLAGAILLTMLLAITRTGTDSATAIGIGVAISLVAAITMAFCLALEFDFESTDEHQT